jgi:hypothetical protein
MVNSTSTRRSVTHRVKPTCNDQAEYDTVGRSLSSLRTCVTDPAQDAGDTSG